MPIAGIIFISCSLLLKAGFMREQLKKILKEFEFPPMKETEIIQEESPTVKPSEQPTVPNKDVPWEKPFETPVEKTE